MSNNPRLKIGAKTVAEADLPSIQKKKAGKSSIDLTFFQDPWGARCGYLMMANSSSFKKKIIRLITPDTAYDYKKGPLWN